MGLASVGTALCSSGGDCHSAHRIDRRCRLLKSVFGTFVRATMTMAPVTHDMGAAAEAHHHKEQPRPKQQIEDRCHRYLRIFPPMGICCIMPWGVSRVSALDRKSTRLNSSH